MSSAPRRVGHNQRSVSPQSQQPTQNNSYTHLRLQTDTCTRTYIHANTCIHTNTYIQTVNKHQHMYIHKHIHTYIHAVNTLIHTQTHQGIRVFGCLSDIPQPSARHDSILHSPELLFQQLETTVLIGLLLWVLGAMATLISGTQWRRGETQSERCHSADARVQSE